MTIRTLMACGLVAGCLMSGPASAQVLLCPDPPQLDVEASDVSAEAERLLKRLTIALDLHGHRGIEEKAIMEAHAETPSALLAKLGNVADRCSRASGDLEGFYTSLPELRKAFLEATDLEEAIDEGDRDPMIKNASNDLSEAERVERSIDLSVRELWRKLWFRPAKGGGHTGDRWAVIVASPSDADSGWDKLGEHQRRWKDAYFQLHEPYYENNPHHAIVIGRRLPRSQAERLRDYAIELGMAADSYVWPLPVDDVSSEVEEAEAVPVEAVAVADDGAEEPEEQEGLDLSVLDR